MGSVLSATPTPGGGVRRARFFDGDGTIPLRESGSDASSSTSSSDTDEVGHPTRRVVVAMNQHHEAFVPPRTAAAGMRARRANLPTAAFIPNGRSKVARDVKTPANQVGDANGRIWNTAARTPVVKSKISSGGGGGVTRKLSPIQGRRQAMTLFPTQQCMYTSLTETSVPP